MIYYYDQFRMMLPIKNGLVKIIPSWKDSLVVLSAYQGSFWLVLRLQLPELQQKLQQNSTGSLGILNRNFVKSLISLKLICQMMW